MTGFLNYSEDYEFKTFTFKVYSIDLKTLNYENFKEIQVQSKKFKKILYINHIK